MMLLALVLLSSLAWAQDPPVQYWAQGPPKVPRTWQPFLDPKSLAFWQEGSYTPPRPLIMAMRNPTPEHIQLYETYLKRRAGILARFHRALKAEKLSRIERILVAFRSDCSASRRFLKALARHPEVVDRIQLLQVDQTPVPTPWPRLTLRPRAIRKLAITTVPTVWVRRRDAPLARLTSPHELFTEVL